MPESKWAARLQEEKKRESDLLYELEMVRHNIATIGRALDEELTGNGNGLSGISTPSLNLDGLPTSQAAKVLLERFGEQGKREVSVGELFDAMKTYRTLTRDRRDWRETTNPWKTFTLSIGRNNRDLFKIKHLHIKPGFKPGARQRIQKTDVISLLTSVQKQDS